MDEWPTFLARPWLAILEEDHPGARLQSLVDGAELTLCWAVAIALAEVHNPGDGALPAAVAAELRAHIERPTLGRWLLVLEVLSRSRPARAILVPAAFDLHASEFARLFLSEEQGATVESSLLVLRNRLAHGGGLSRTRASDLFARHVGEVAGLTRATAAATESVDVLAVRAGVAWRLRGPQPAQVSLPDVLQTAGDGLWLVGAQCHLTLLPIADFAPASPMGQREEGSELDRALAPLLYRRALRDRLAYTSLAGETEDGYRLEIQAFRRLFRLDVAGLGQARTTREDQNWDAFLREAAERADGLVGRALELHSVKTWLRARQPRSPDASRVGWIAGPAGMGKSLLMARLATDFANPNHRGLYYHCFRAGDQRNSRRAFLQLLRAALLAWMPMAKRTDLPTWEPDSEAGLLDDVRTRLHTIEPLQPVRPDAPAPVFWVLVDGLDEVVAADPGLPDLLVELAVPGTLWLIGSRPEPRILRAFRHPACDELFPAGLPPLQADDIRAMLLEGLGSMRQALLRRDREDDDAQHVGNAFVDRVTHAAAGLPLYVHLLVEDLRAGRLTVHDEHRLPDGLQAYYADLMGRTGLSSVGRDLSLLVAVLARAEEPLDADAFAALLAGGHDEARYYPDRVQRALRAGAVLLRSVPTPEGTEGFSLYHQSLREYLGGRTADAAAVSPLVDVVAEAERLLCRLAARCSELPPGNLRNHLFRWGTTYALRWQGPAGARAAAARLTDFAWLQLRLAASASVGPRGVASDCTAVLAALPDDGERQRFAIWEAFFRGRVHLLRRCSDAWPAHRILAQLAVEHADDSPVTKAAEAWLQDGGCDWLWLRRVDRPAALPDEGEYRVLPAPNVRDVRELPDGRLLTFSVDGRLRFWDAGGECEEMLVGHEGPDNSTTEGVFLSDGLFVSWWDDHVLRLWDLDRRCSLACFRGHQDEVRGVNLLDLGRLLSWSRREVCLWDLASGRRLAAVAGDGALPVDAHRIVTWGAGGLVLRRLDGLAQIRVLSSLDPDQVALLAATTLLYWKSPGWVRAVELPQMATSSAAPECTIAENRQKILPLPANQAVLFRGPDDDDRSVVWDVRSHSVRLTLDDAGLYLRGQSTLSNAWELPGDRLVTKAFPDDFVLRVWDLASGRLLHELRGHADTIFGVVPLPDGTIASYSRDGTARVWNLDSGACTLLYPHSTAVGTFQVLGGGLILTTSADATMRVWSRGVAPPAGADPNYARGRYWEVSTPLFGRRLAVSDGRESLAVFNLATGCVDVVMPGTTACCVLPSGRVATRNADGDFQLWDLALRQPLARVPGHGTSSELRELPHGGLLTWGWNGLVRLWRSGADSPKECRADGTYVNGALPLRGGRILLWTSHHLTVWHVATGTRSALVVEDAGDDVEIDGVLALADGTAVAWSNDHLVRHWDPAAAKVLSTMAGHSKEVRGAFQLANGQILSWDDDEAIVWGDDGGDVLRTDGRHLWGLQLFEEAGRLLGWTPGTIFVWQADSLDLLWCGDIDAPATAAADAWAMWQVATRPGECCGPVRFDSHPVIALHIASHQAQWHQDGERFDPWGFADGTVAVAGSAEGTTVLQLMHGNHRVTVAEAALRLGATAEAQSAFSRQVAAAEKLAAAEPADGHRARMLATCYTNLADFDALVGHTERAELNRGKAEQVLARLQALYAPQPASASQPQSHAGADPERAFRLNLAHQEALAAWRALPTWRRAVTKKPVPPTGI